MFGSGTALSARPRKNLQHRLQFAGLKHLHHDVAAADEGLVDVELWDRWPVAEALDAFANLRILNHVDRVEFCAALLQDGDRASRESAHWELWRAFHEEHDLVGVEDLLNAVVSLFDCFHFLFLFSFAGEKS